MDQAKEWLRDQRFESLMFAEIQALLLLFLKQYDYYLRTISWKTNPSNVISDIDSNISRITI